MKESYRKGVANHPDPESCVASRKAAVEALTGAHAGQGIELRNQSRPGCRRRSAMAEGNTDGCAIGEPSADSAQSETLGMHGNSTRENRETPSAPVADGAAGRSEKAMSRTSSMHAGGESDGRVVPTKRPNKGGQTAGGGRGGKATDQGEHGAGDRVPDTEPDRARRAACIGVREAARRDKRTRFTALLHHVTVDLLRDSFYALKREAAPGVDGVTWEAVRDGPGRHGWRTSIGRVHRGTYRAQPSKRAYIPKADGRQRPLGIAALEDKIVQQAVVTVLNQIYEEDFLGFSYGFRPGRSQHDALDALWVGSCGRR